MSEARAFRPDLVLGNVRVDLGAFAVFVKDVALRLTFFEFELLRILCRELDRIIYYDALCEALWQSTGRNERRRLSVLVRRLRIKLAGSWPYRVETVRRRGYGLVATRPLLQRR